MDSVPVSVETLAVRVAVLERQQERNSEQHGELYARVEAVEKGHAVLNTNLGNIWTVLKEIQADVKAIKDVPQKRAETVRTEVIKSIATAVAGAILAVAGIGLSS